MVTGAHKAELLKRMIASDISGELPATYLKGLPQASLYTNINTDA